MTAHDIDAVFRFRLAARKRSDNVYYLRRLWNTRDGLLSELIKFDLEPAARFATVSLEFRFDPAAGRAYAARVAFGFRQRVARVKTDKFFDRRFDIRS